MPETRRPFRYTHTEERQNKKETGEEDEKREEKNISM